MASQIVCAFEKSGTASGQTSHVLTWETYWMQLKRDVEREREHVNIAFHLVIGRSLTLNYICHTGEYTYDDGEDRKNKKDDR